MHTERLSSLISAEELKTRLQQSEPLFVFDARGGEAGRKAFASAHLKGARYIDLDTDLSEIKNPAKGGRHPLPQAGAFKHFVSHDLGLSHQSHVIIYDDHFGGNAAARLWWMLRALGFMKVQVVDGGLQEIQRHGLPVVSTSGLVYSDIQNKMADAQRDIRMDKDKSANWLWPLINLEELERAMAKNQYLLIDVREPERYLGISEPIDLVAGHIPGAINQPYRQNLDENGCFLTPEKLREIYSRLIGKRPIEEIVVHCGSGVTACHSILAMDIAGMGIPCLYTGSWSEWSRNDKPIVQPGH